MTNICLASMNIELTERDSRYILYAIRELMAKLEYEIEKDPGAELDITPMYTDDVLSLRDVHNRLKDKALPAFGESILSVSYDTL